MKIYINPAKDTWSELSLRAAAGETPKVEAAVRTILQRVKTGGDRELAAITCEIEHRDISSGFKVSEEEFEQAESLVPTTLKDAIAAAYRNISAFHQAQYPREIQVETSPGTLCIQRPVAIRSVGIYIPGGTAPLFSTVLMLAIPAKIAGCPRRIICTPCGPDGKVAPAVLYAAAYCGVKDVFKIGGAQAIAAMAYGTETVPKVDKIFGPGNRYVTVAKQLVAAETTAIDMPAGPSEVMVVADETCNPQFVAADLLSQCEHGADSQAIAVCNSPELAERIAEATHAQAESLSRSGYIYKSLENSRIIVFPDREKMLEFADFYGPEHLILSISDPMAAVSEISVAGSVFIGNFSPESAGDYASGTNHTLPTSGWASSFSGVNTESFMRKITIQHITPEGLGDLEPVITAMAEAEGLDAHANAVKIRLKNGD